MEIILDPHLREYDVGQMAGKSRTEMTDAEWADFRNNAEKYGAETTEQIQARCKTFIRHLRKNKIDNALIVSHGGLIKHFLYLSENREPNNENWWRLHREKISHLDIVKIDALIKANWYDFFALLASRCWYAMSALSGMVFHFVKNHTKTSPRFCSSRFGGAYDAICGLVNLLVCRGVIGRFLVTHPEF
jgi:hypothetical protein